MGVNPPYNFVLNAVHGGLGQRFFFTDRVALRIEARAYYPTSNPYFGGKKSLDATASAGLSVFLLGGGGPHEAAPPPLPPEKRESVVVAGGQATPPAGAPTPAPTPAFAPPPAPAPAPAPIPAVERRTPAAHFAGGGGHADQFEFGAFGRDRKSTRLNSSHVRISYAVFCLKKKKNHLPIHIPTKSHRKS